MEIKKKNFILYIKKNIENYIFDNNDIYFINDKQYIKINNNELDKRIKSLIDLIDLKYDKIIDNIKEYKRRVDKILEAEEIAKKDKYHEIGTKLSFSVFGEEVYNYTRCVDDYKYVNSFEEAIDLLNKDIQKQINLYSYLFCYLWTQYEKENILLTEKNKSLINNKIPNNVYNPVPLKTDKLASAAGGSNNYYNIF
jgi:hypothetical protein